jgi:hypothetical protein
MDIYPEIDIEFQHMEFSAYSKEIYETIFCNFQ